jgi:asparagine synthase (glutamine-hydrolysing)
MAAGPGEPYSRAAAQEYRDRLTEAVRMRLVGEVPVGTALSGGLDSSTTVMLIDELLDEHAADTESIGKRQQTFSAVFKGESNDEERYVDAVLDDCDQRIDGHKIRPVADEFTEDLTEFVRVMEEPIISTGPYAQYRVMKYATNHVTVLLDGQGADETMAGYPPYYFVYLRQLKARKQYRELARELRTSRDILWRFATHTKRDTLVRKKKVPIVDLLQSDFAGQFASETFPVIQDNLKLRLIQDIFYVSLPTLLRYEDKNTMQFSLEGRVPFLDKEVLKYQFALADDSIIHDGWNKRILRDATENLLPEMINKRRNKIGFTTPEDAWFDRLKSEIYTIFASEEFASRPYFNAEAVLSAYQEFIAGKNDTGSMLFWRFLNVELWLREFFDPPKAAAVEVAAKSDLVPNEHKELDLQTYGGQVRRFPLQTGAVQEHTDIDRFVHTRVAEFMQTIADAPQAEAEVLDQPWYLFISEKIIAISQGRSWLLTDIKPSWWARTLSKGVSKTPYGIGLGAPETMQLAIQEAGLPRILWASAAGLAGKIVGKRGVFYNRAGSDVRAIDGPTAHSAYPSNVSAKLAPKDPQQVAKRLSKALRSQLPEAWAARFGGTVVIDANDLGRNILGDDTGLPDATLEGYFEDNPLGQGKEMTPLAIVVALP